MSENREIYSAGKNFTLPPAVTALTNITSDIPIVVGTHSLRVSTSLFDFDFTFRRKFDFPCVYFNLKVFLFSAGEWHGVYIYSNLNFFFSGEWHGINFDQNYGDAAFHAVDVGRLAF